MAYIYLLLGAISIAFAPILVKLSSLPEDAIVFYRCIFGFLAIYCYACFDQKKLLFPKGKRWLFFASGGLIFCLDLYFWHFSINIVGAGLATVIANTQVFFAAIISHFFFKEKVPKSFLAWAILGLVGLYFLCVPEPKFLQSTEYLKGIALGLAAGAFYSLFLSSIKLWQREFPSDPKYYPILWLSLGTSSWMLVIGDQSLAKIDGDNLLWMLLLGVLVHAGGWLLINKSIESLEFSKVSLGLLLQPILASIIAYFMFSESLVMTQIAGLSLCVFAIYRGQMDLAKAGKS